MTENFEIKKRKDYLILHKDVCFTRDNINHLSWQILYNKRTNLPRSKFKPGTWNIWSKRSTTRPALDSDENVLPVWICRFLTLLRSTHPPLENKIELRLKKTSIGKLLVMFHTWKSNAHFDPNQTFALSLLSYTIKELDNVSFLWLVKKKLKLKKMKYDDKK